MTISQMRDSSINYESVEQQVDNRINEIEKMRQQTINYNKQQFDSQNF